MAAAAAALPGFVSAPEPWTPDPGVGAAEAVAMDAGQLVEAVGQLSSGCTATVIDSASRTLAVTAARCVHIPATAPGRRDAAPGYRADLTFQPGRVGDEAPYGVWQVQRVWVEQQWVDSADPRFDYAFIELAPRAGELIADVVGGLVVSTSGSEGNPAATVVGYPTGGGVEGHGGRGLWGCSTSEVGVVPDEPRFDAVGAGQLALGCDMAHGAEGGPWLARSEGRAEAGPVMAVTSTITAGADGEVTALVGAPLGAAARELELRAEQEYAVAVLLDG